MLRFARLAALGAAVLLGGCVADGAAPAMPTRSASATIPSAGEPKKIAATVKEVAGGLQLVVEASGLSPGAHGLHFHGVGRCDTPDFTSAGPHWNPTGRKHGRDSPDGAHRGDLPNLIVGSDGRGRLETILPGARLIDGPMPLLDADGAAIVVHEAADDHRTDPSGNSGARVVCAEFTGA